MHRHWLRYLTAIALAFLLGQPGMALSADAFRNYLADYYLLESVQAKAPQTPLSYTGKQGALLSAVLGGEQAKSAFDFYKANYKMFGDLPDQAQFVKEMRPMFERYANAFKREPAKYEVEYLDTMALQNQVLKTTIQINKIGTEQADKSTKAMLSQIESMMNTTRGFLGDTLSTQIGKGMFSEKNAERARRITAELKEKFTG